LAATVKRLEEYLADTDRFEGPADLRGPEALARTEDAKQQLVRAKQRMRELEEEAQRDYGRPPWELDAP
jgi:hypothetical protein